MQHLIGYALAVAVSAAMWTASPPSAGQPQRQPAPLYASGAYLFRTFCASCHGDAGRGDGQVAGVLRVPPSDLTTISARNDGSFPRARVLAFVDGRTPVPGHGRREMPVWGDVLRITEGHDERIVAARLDALVTYIESMQRRSP